MDSLAVGIDVQVRRGCPIAVLGPDGSSVAALWAEHPEAAGSLLGEVLDREGIAPSRVAIGIDAPRMPLPQPRPYCWSGAARRWRPRGGKQRGLGRHCEVAISAHRLAHPQWSPLAGEAPEWMQHGFQLYESLAPLGRTYEAFPSASYRQLRDTEAKIEVALGAFGAGPKDMLDAYVAALTAREYELGRGCAVGGGDGLGTIILPRPLQDPIEEVLAWPGGSDGPDHQ